MKTKTSQMFMSRITSILMNGNVKHNSCDGVQQTISGKNSFVEDIISITNSVSDEKERWRALHAFFEDGVFSTETREITVKYYYGGQILETLNLNVMPGETRGEVARKEIQSISFHHGYSVNDITFFIEKE